MLMSVDAIIQLRSLFWRHLSLLDHCFSSGRISCFVFAFCRYCTSPRMIFACPSHLLVIYHSLLLLELYSAKRELHFHPYFDHNLVSFGYCTTTLPFSL